MKPIRRKPRRLQLPSCGPVLEYKFSKLTVECSCGSEECITHIKRGYALLRMDAGDYWILVPLSRN